MNFFQDQESTDNLLQKYHRLGYTQNEMRVSLTVKHSINISARQLKRHLNRLHLFRRKNYTDLADVTVFLMNELRTSAQQLGYRMMQLKCINAGLIVSRDTIRHLLGVLDPRGVELRRKGRIVRRCYLSKGANFVWHLDSYDKLKPYGICINGCIDGFSRSIIWLEAYRTSSDAKLIAGYFMQSVRRLGGCPMRIRGDMGTENSHVALLQRFMRRDGIDSWCGESSFLYGKSTANQRIESFWSILRKQHCQFWISEFKQLKEDGDFTGSDIDKEIIRFCFLQLIQRELQDFVQVWSAHRIRPSKFASGPFGRPSLMYDAPEAFGGSQCLVSIREIDVSACFETCKYKTILPCERDIYELAKICMEEHGWTDALSPEDALKLYKDLHPIITSLVQSQNLR